MTTDVLSSYEWLTALLRDRDPNIEAHYVVADQLRLLVAVRAERFITMPLEGHIVSKLEVLGGIKTSGFFALNAEGEEVRLAFLDRVLQALDSPAAPKRLHETNLFDRFLRGL